MDSNKFAFVFPGQGSQSMGMLSDLANKYGEIRSVFERASDALAKDLWELVKDGPEVELSRTENTQPIMLAAGYACFLVWQDCDLPST